MGRGLGNALPEIDGYTLAEVTESDAEEGVYSWAEQGAGWYYVLDSEEGIRIDGYSDGLELQVFWVEDKDSEGDMNPDSEAYPDPELTSPWKRKTLIRPAREETGRTLRMAGTQGSC